MPITVQWHNPEQTIVNFHFTAAWTWAEYDTAAQQARTMMDNVQHKIDIILEFDPKGRLPGNSFLNIQRAIANPHRNQGIIVIVGLNVFIRMVGSVMESVYPALARERKLAANLEEAQRIISEIQRERSQSTI